MAINSYRDLIVWQKSFSVVVGVYHVTRQLPASEKFGLASQLQRVVVSIPSNIAEGQQRHNLREYYQFLGIARGSAAELETQLLLVQALYNLDTTILIKDIHEIQKMLRSLTQKLQI